MIVARISEKVYYSKGGLAEHYQKKHNKKGGTAGEDYLTGQIVTNFKLLELVIRAAEKIQKQGYYSTNLKDELTVFSITVTEKDTVDYTLTCPRLKWKTLMIFLQPMIVSLFALVANIVQS